MFGRWVLIFLIVDLSASQSNEPTDDMEMSIARSRIEVNRLFDDYEKQLFKEFQSTKFHPSTLQWNELRHSDEFAKTFSRTALIIERASKFIRNANPKIPFGSVAPIGDICPVVRIEECFAGKYRSLSGQCNNVQKPLWGSAHEPFQRLLSSQYSDGISKPRLSSNGTELLSSRIISRSVFGDSLKADKFCTLMFPNWAQFVYADLAQSGCVRLFGEKKSLPLPCCGAQHPECFPILTDRSDSLYNDREYCIPYSRSITAPRSDCSFGPREQSNIATSFLDGSPIYGSDSVDSRKLRTLIDGQLKSPKSLNGTNSPWSSLLPTNFALYSLWIRQHNRVASELKKRNPHWNDERLFEESRRIIIAQIQHITYSEFLPLLIGKEEMIRRNLTSLTRGFESRYDLKINPQTLNSFGSAVGLFFFSLFGDSIRPIDSKGKPLNSQKLSTLFQKSNNFSMDSLLRFLIAEPMKSPGLNMSLELRENFLRTNGSNGVDLAALIIQMGRDHGLPTFVQMREFCGLQSPKDFAGFRSIVRSDVNISALQRVYGKVEDGDLFVLGLAERPLRGSLIGPTFSCVLGKQFEMTKFGDRLWYENSFDSSAFNSAQSSQIKKTTLAEILCSNTKDLGKIQPKVLERPDDTINCPIDCSGSTFARPNWDEWKDGEEDIRLPITDEVLRKALTMGREQYRRYVEHEKKKFAQLGIESKRGVGSMYTHGRYAAPKPEAMDRAKMAGILREATNILIRGEGLEENEKLPDSLDIPTLQRLLPKVDVPRIIGYYDDYLENITDARQMCLPKPLPCDHTNPYRTPSGWCNNLRFPDYGVAFEPMRRFLEPVYDDGFDSPRGHSVTGNPLPPSRRISVRVHNDDQHEDANFSHMLMQMGQLLDHDITHSPLSRGPANQILNCSTCDSPETLSIHCFPLPIDRNDPYFPSHHTDGSPRCIPMARSILGQVTLGYRNQLNQLTSFIDVSHVYGSTDCETHSLRSHKDGKLNFTDLGHNKEALPQGPQERLCHTNPHHKCFNAGDERNNIQPGLTAVHTIMLRDHNRLSTQLKKLNSHWEDEKLFQESRRILIAKFQHIVYGEWLPVVLGCELMDRFGLWPLRDGFYDEYDPTCNAMMSQEFSMAAFRFGHTLIRNVFPRMDSDFNSTRFGGGLELRENFNNVTALYQPELGHMESILMGLLGTPEMQFNRHASNAVRNHLFQYLGGPYTGLDLIAVNIQRGRDHGMPPYNAYREIAGLQRAKTFEDLSSTMTADTIKALKSVYESVEDIDLFTGMMSEKPHKGSLIGPMAAYFVAEQFQKLKKCDRFFYETSNPYIRFTKSQLEEIRKSSFAKMICENSDFARRIPPNVFKIPDDLTNAPISCDRLPEMDLDPWTDRKFCSKNGKQIQLGKTDNISPCVTCTCTIEGLECHSVTVQYCEDLITEFGVENVQKDTVCVIQCSPELRRMQF